MKTATDLELLRAITIAREKLHAELSKVIVGQSNCIDLCLIALFCGGHCLLIGVPGLGKTLLVKTLGKSLGLPSSRVQFTPDLMPADLTGTEILQQDRDSGKRIFSFHKGPVFTSLLLADEINRTPPKTQAALLEAMQEGQVTVAGVAHVLPKPFMVLATQNPVEQEGTYPLPEAQLDRFLLAIKMGYPSLEEEVRIAGLNPETGLLEIEPVLDGQRILELQALLYRVPVADHVLHYAVDLIRATRPGPNANSLANEYLLWGAGPRAVQHLVRTARANAILEGRPSPGLEDLSRVFVATLSHRLVLNFRAQTESVSAEDILTGILDSVMPERRF